MDEMHRSSSNTKSIENEDNEHITQEDDASDEQNGDSDSVVTDRIRETSDKSLHEIEPVAGTFPIKTHSRTDLNIDLNTNDDDDDDNDFKTEAQSPHVKRADLIVNNAYDTKAEEKSESVPLEDYLNEHERFLKSIDRTRQLSIHERKQLERQKEDLKKLQDKVANQVEEKDIKRQYAKQKEEEMLRRKRAYQKRRVEEAKLKATRKPRIQTTYHIPIEQNRSKSQTPHKKLEINHTQLPLSSAKNQSQSNMYMFHTNSPTSSRLQKHMECQTDTDNVNKSHTEHRLDKHSKGHSGDVGKSLEDLIVHVVEHSKRAWINE